MANIWLSIFVANICLVSPESSAVAGLARADNICPAQPTTTTKQQGFSLFRLIYLLCTFCNYNLMTSILLAEPLKPEMSAALQQNVRKLSISANVVGTHPKVNQITSVMSNPTLLTKFLHFSPFPLFPGCLLHSIDWLTTTGKQT